MNKFSRILSGIKVLEEVNSKQNGQITVVKSFAFGTYFQVGGLTQSGGIIKNIWKHSLREVHRTNSKVQNVLVLGLGGGSIISVIKKYWPDSQTTAVDIDPVIVDLGKKYLGLGDSLIKIKISDAEKFLVKSKTRFDLICADLYVGDEYPKKFEDIKFAKLLKRSISKNGVVVINRLYYGEKRPQTVKFGNILVKVFSSVDVVYPEANLMYVCSN